MTRNELKRIILSVYLFSTKIHHQEIWNAGEIVFDNDIDIQADSFFHIDENGKSSFDIPSDNIIPVLTKESVHQEKESESVVIRKNKDLFVMMDSIRNGDYAHVKTLTISVKTSILNALYIILQVFGGV